MLIGVVMTQLRGRSIGLATALALGALLLAGCGGHKSANNNTPAPSGTTAPASAPSSAPASSGGGYGY
jgi:hypothetical protein